MLSVQFVHVLYVDGRPLPPAASRTHPPSSSFPFRARDTQQTGGGEKGGL